MRSLVCTLLLLIIVLIFEGSAWSQCAMCRTALEHSEEGQAIAEGFRSGILLLLAAPYALIGGLSFRLVQAHKKRRKSTR